MSTSELAASYAALILADDGVEITADKLTTLITAAKVPDVEPIWMTLFAKALEGKDVKDLLLNVGSGGGAAAAPAAGGAAAAGGDAGGAAEAAEEKEEGKFHQPRAMSGREYHDVDAVRREGRVRRGHGFRSLRLNGSSPRYCCMKCYAAIWRAVAQRNDAGRWNAVEEREEDTIRSAQVLMLPLLGAHALAQSMQDKTSPTLYHTKCKPKSCQIIIPCLSLIVTLTLRPHRMRLGIFAMS
nr:60s acidic ribosomal protein p1 [Quercus suber]